MSVTSYDTVNGRLIGECTSGVTTTYLTDEQGSVVRTARSGQMVNQYEFTPYGLLFSKVGTGSDPRFMWSGALSFRTTLRTFAEFLLQSRHYSSTTARWANVRAAGSFQTPYQFRHSNPSGRPLDAPVTITRKSDQCSETECGDLQVSFIMSLKTDQNGWLIQHVKRNVAGVYCSSGSSVYDCCGHCEFYEAWQVIDGIVQAPTRAGGWTPPVSGDTDTWIVINGGCTQGFAMLFGELSFMGAQGELGDRPVGWNPKGQNKCSGYLPSVSKLPNGTTLQPWTNQLTVSSHWQCCDQLCKGDYLCTCTGSECGAWYSSPNLLACEGVLNVP